MNNSVFPFEIVSMRMWKKKKKKKKKQFEKKFVTSLGSHITAYEYSIEAEQTCIIHDVINTGCKTKQNLRETRNNFINVIVNALQITVYLK